MRFGKRQLTHKKKEFNYYSKLRTNFLIIQFFSIIIKISFICIRQKIRKSIKTLNNIARRSMSIKPLTHKHQIRENKNKKKLKLKPKKKRFIIT